MTTITITGMEPIQRRQPTGTFCRRGHPQFIEVRTVQIRGAEQYAGQIGPSCFRHWCPAHKEFKRSQERPG